jgi:hypothetical protein
LITSEFLRGIRRKALRRGVWHSTLDKLDRGILNLTIKLVENVKSSTLGVAVTRILARLIDASKTPFMRFFEDHGYTKLRNIVNTAISFGSCLAGSWLSDHDFAWYLSVNSYNNCGFGWDV